MLECVVLATDRRAIEVIKHNPLNAYCLVLTLGLYACLITAKPQSDEVRLALSFAEASVYVMVSLSSQQSKDGTQRILVPFLPAFYINHSELVFSSKQLSGEIKVLGTEKVLEKLEVHETFSLCVTIPGNTHYLFLGKRYAC